MPLTLSQALSRRSAPPPAVVQPSPMSAALVNAGTAPVPTTPRPIQIDGPRSDALAKALMGSGLQSETIETPIEAIGKLAQVWGGKRAQDRYIEAEEARDEAKLQEELAGYESLLSQAGDAPPMVQALIRSRNPDLAKFGVEQLFAKPQDRQTFTQDGVVYDMATRQPLIEGSEPPAPDPYTDVGKVLADREAGLISDEVAARELNRLMQSDQPTPYTDAAKIEADRAAGLITDEQAAEALEKIQRDDGEFKQLTTPEDRAAAGIPPEDTGIYQVGPDKKLYRVGSDGTTVNINDAKLTEGQSKDIGFYSRGRSADIELAPVEKVLTELDQAFWSGLPLGNYALTPEYQQAARAASELLAVILRKDTGAAITSQEFDLYGPMYLPVPGDSDQVIAAKRAARANALAAIKMGLGTARELADQIDTDLAGREAAAPTTEADAPVTPDAPVVPPNLEPGQSITLPDGTIIERVD